MNPDFKMLVGLSIIDMLLRYRMLPVTLDVEHFARERSLEGGDRESWRRRV